MKKIRKDQMLVIFFTVFMSVVHVYAWTNDFTVYFNHTNSMPRGFYLKSPGLELKRGRLVSVCIPENEFSVVFEMRNYMKKSDLCDQHSGLSPILKPIIGVPGDFIEIRKEATLINDIPYEASELVETDSDGLPMAHMPTGWKYKLGSDEYFVLANHQLHSLDSRYFGPIKEDMILTTIVPIITLR